MTPAQLTNLIEPPRPSPEVRAIRDQAARVRAQIAVWQPRPMPEGWR